MIDSATKARFMAKFTRGKDDECWNWNAAIGNGTGYGIMGMGTRASWKSTGAHRIAWMIFKGEIPEGLCVLHRCDNRKCVNPNHLFLGTDSDNIKDAAAKGRMPRGEKHWNAKISEENCQKIFVLKHQGVTQTEIAKMFGVTQGHVRDIINGRRRQHAP